MASMADLRLDPAMTRDEIRAALVQMTSGDSPPEGSSAP